ncbi:MAG: right-handed parallel beta-helix repeat-containing protein [Deltaproteobacteria bacterium]|nr:right-handed parallel beta-helix repeat-containing protein [Deltaproteobacteria bacterium]
MKNGEIYLRRLIFCFRVFPLTAIPLLFIFTQAFGAEWHVSQSGGDFTTIQSAINAMATADGDTIWVDAGTYRENVVVNRPVIIRSQHGYASTTVEAANPAYPGFTVTADQVTIRGFTVYGTTGNGSGDAGIYLDNYTQYCTIADNRCGYDAAHHSDYGISVNHSGPGHNISNNICNANTYYGIHLNNSNADTILGNICANNGMGGISLIAVTNITVIGNNCEANAVFGLDQSGAVNCAAIGNTFSGNLIGLWTSGGSSNTFYFNNFNSNETNFYSFDSANNWRSPTRVSYIYNGALHSGYLGNFYANHDLSDTDGDGVTDAPYADDEYPLAAASGNYSLVILPLLAGDVDGDGDVDGFDLSGLSRNFGMNY